MKVTNSSNWQQRVGNQRDWVWRGWRIRYTYQRSLSPNATPVLLIHGFGASIGHWRHNLPALTENHTIYALDLLGFGGSTKAATTYKIDLWVDLVYEFWLPDESLPKFVNQIYPQINFIGGSCLGRATKTQ